MEISNLEQTIRDACRINAPTKPIFTFEGLFPRKKSVFWKGNDINEFFKAMDKVNPNFLYISVYETGSEAVPDKYKNLVYEVDLVFVFNGLFHIFKKHAEWFDEMMNEMSEEDDKKDKKSYDALLRMDEKEKVALINSFSLARVMDSEPELVLYRLKRLFFSHLVVNHGFPDFLITQRFGVENSEEDNQLYELANSLFDEIQKEWNRIENEKVNGILPKCIEWARTNGLKTVTQGDVEIFLDQHGLSLSSKSKRDLWNNVKFALKRVK